MELVRKIKVGENEFSEIEVFPETAKTMSRAVFAAEGDLEILPLARVVARTGIKGLEARDWNLINAGNLSADDYIVLLNAVSEFDENFTPPPHLVLR